VAEANNIVVFTADLDYTVRKGIVHIEKAIPDICWLVALHAPQKSFSILIRNQWLNFRRNGWRWLPYIFIETAKLYLVKSDFRPNDKFPGYQYTLQWLSKQPNIKIIRVSDIHAPKSLEIVREFAPKLGLSLSAPILKPSLFSIPTEGTLNLHKGKVPDYRGMPPAFWELWNNENAIGCTVHFVDSKLDTGAVVREAAIERKKFSTLRGLQLTLDELGIDLMCEAVRDVLSRRVNARPQLGNGRTYRKPTLRQREELRKRLNLPKPRTVALIKDTAKKIFFATRITWSRHIGSTIDSRGSVTVLLYHKVNDEIRDNLTVGVEQFNRQMELVGKYCHVLSLDQVLAGDFPQLGKPNVCITFDDGYLDNFQYAVPILLRNNLPASFFVCTGVLDGTHLLPHDVARNGQAAPYLNWDQVLEMRRQGFGIGSHGVTHLDCGAETDEVVRSELVHSLNCLRSRLDLKDVVFAYPFGGRRNMTPQKLTIVKELGYSACLSAYGGVNKNPIDRFNVMRVGIDWSFSDAAFLYRCYGLARNV